MTDAFDVTVFNHDGEQLMLYCPACQTDLTLAKPERGESRPPRGGDVTVCFHCLAYLSYREIEPGQLCLDVMPREAYEALPEAQQIGLIQIRAELATRVAQVPTKWEAALATQVTKLQQRVAALQRGQCSCGYCRSGDGLNCVYRRRLVTGAKT